MDGIVIKYEKNEKSILKLGKALNKTEQKEVNGGTRYYLPICECNGHGYKINLPCEGNCEKPEVPLPDICDVFPDLC